MPTAPLKPCRWPAGCPRLTAGRFCAEHQAAAYRLQDQRRGSAASRGYDARHRRWRLLVLARDPLCVLCVAEGATTPATVADHITPLRDGGDWSVENGQGVCSRHHSMKSLAEAQPRKPCAVDGCTSPAIIRGWCNRHYLSWYKHGDPEKAKRADRPPSSRCTVEGCADPPRSTFAEYCEMHYMRLRRNGDPTRLVERPDRVLTSHGYVRVKRLGHALADERGWVYEHRAMLYDTIGPGAHACRWCGNRVTWEKRYPESVEGLVVDHVDGDKQHNNPENLVPACNPCNGRRDQDRRGRGEQPCAICGALSDREFCSPACSGRAGAARKSLEEMRRG